MSNLVQFLVIASSLFVVTQAYGFRYRFDPYTQDTQLWTHHPGIEQPVVYANNFAVQSKFAAEDQPGIYKYRGTDGKQRWRCKFDAYYSEFLQKCLWKPEHFSKAKRF